MVRMKAGAGGCVGKYNIMCKYLPEDDNCVYNQQETGTATSSVHRTAQS